jgi:SAM-dependent methyltransferase
VRLTRDGIPLLVSDLDAYLQAFGEELEAELDEMPFSSLAYLARYVPMLLAPKAPLRRAVRDALRRHMKGDRVGLAVELGCSVGVDLRTLSALAHEVIGIDISIPALRAARVQLSGRSLPVFRRVEGRSFETEEPMQLPALDNVTLAVGNALDPPLFPEVADVAVAVNLLDTVRNPLSLVGQLDAILAPSGLLVITTPLSWNEEITPPEEALGGGTAGAWARLGTPAGLVELLSGRLPLLPYLRYEILEQTDVPWTVREHARMVTTYEVHVLVARKLEG